jgi:hypothetical protein
MLTTENELALCEIRVRYRELMRTLGWFEKRFEEITGLDGDASQHFLMNADLVSDSKWKQEIRNEMEKAVIAN